MFYFLCFVKDISTDMLEEQVSEEIDPDLNEEEDIIIEESREENWMDVSDNGEDKSEIHALRWYVYTREKDDFIKRYVLVSFTHPKGGVLFGLL